MNLIRRISEFSPTENLFLQRCRKATPQLLKTPKLTSIPLFPAQFLREYETQAPPYDAKQTTWPHVLSLFTDKHGRGYAESLWRQNLVESVSRLTDEILSQNSAALIIEDETLRKNTVALNTEKVLDEQGVHLFRKYCNGVAVVELLMQLQRLPLLGIAVLNWRRKRCDSTAPLTAEEYSKGIILAGRYGNADLALELFNEASEQQLKTTSVYNSLMSAYMYCGQAMKCQSLFQDLKADSTCTPSIVTYNILITAFGRLMLVDHMEAILKEINDQYLSPTIHTYKGLMAGYVTAWMWEDMEKTYWIMSAGPVKPDLDIHLLMLRGYAHSGQLDKMEQMYEMARDHVDQKETPLIRSMICAYSRSSHVAKVAKIEELLRQIPANEYKSWLNVLLITLYAKEDLLERMESSINEAFEHKTYVTTVGVMRCIISSYFRHNAVDKLAYFLKRAEDAGWKICRSLYHCKMVMYSSQMRLSEMERVLVEMDKINMPLSKKTFWILYKTYKNCGERSKLEQVVGLMCKHGHGVPLETGNS